MLNLLIRKAHSFVFHKTSGGEIISKIFDIGHHLKYSFKEKNLKVDKDHLKYYLTKHYHIIEKGLALNAPRLGFGQPKILSIIEKTKIYECAHGSDAMVCSIRKTILEYMKFNANNEFIFPRDFEVTVADFLSRGSSDGSGGLKNLSKASASTLNIQEFSAFSKGRVSVRNFSNEDVPTDALYSAVEIAKNAPSVCNRQGWKVHLYNDKTKMSEILSHQNGNAGFTESINKLLIVTVDAKAFTKYESNQIFIDGGLFSMNLLLAIHAAGLGACCLNTCYPYSLENKVKTVASIPNEERLIMMIAVGCLKEHYSVALSTRNPTDEILVSH